MNTYNKTHRRSGFSLVELSITLMVIGLVIGGVVLGQNLLRSAELRATPNEISKFNAATLTFREKFRQLPGDFTKATTIWGTNSSCGSATTAETATCNGDGNNIIMSLSFASFSFETWLFWQHLSNAGLIEGKYLGNPANVSGLMYSDVIGESIPPSKMRDAGYAISAGAASSWSTDNKTLHSFLFGGVTPAEPIVCPPGLSCDYVSVSTAGSKPSLSPTEAWSLDKKYDDGKPGYGKIMADRWGSGCVSSTDATTASYDSSNEGNTCSMIFNSGF